MHLDCLVQTNMSNNDKIICTSRLSRSCYNIDIAATTAQLLLYIHIFHLTYTAQYRSASCFVVKQIDYGRKVGFLFSPQRLGSLKAKEYVKVVEEHAKERG